MKHSLESATICTAMVAKFYGYPADVGLLQEKLHKATAQDINVEADAAFQLLAEAVGLSVKVHDAAGESFSDLPLPALCLDTAGNWFVLARVEGDRFLVHRHDSSIPTVLEKHQFLACYAGKVVLAKPKETMHDKLVTFSLQWMLKILFKNRKIFFEIALASIVLQIIGLIFPLFFQVVMDKVITHNSLSTLNVVTFGLVVVTLFEMIIGFSRTFIFSRVVSKIDAEVSSNIYTHLLSLPIRYFESRRVGDIVSRVKEIEGLRSFLTGQAFSAVLDLLFSFVFFCVLFYYSVELTLLVIISFILYFIFVRIIGPFIKSGLNEKYESASDSYSFLVESVSGIQTVKSLCLERKFGREWDSKVTKNLTASFHVSLLASLGQQGIQFINKALTITILYFGAKEVIDGRLSIGQLVAFNMLSGQLAMPILRIVQAILDYQQFSVSVGKIADIFSFPKETVGSNSKLSILHGGVEFKNVSFRYPGAEKTVLNELDLSVRPGEIVGVTGRSGSGKSTLYKLFQRLYSIENGQILLDGVDVRNFDIGWLRQQVGVVMQEGFLFNRTIRENISLSHPGCSMDLIVRAAKLSGADEFISNLPAGYETIVEEGGANFSGGQKQRIAIARALLMNPKILIFDEATSALDYESEALIQKNMKDICHGRTVIIIAHRLNTLKVADKIFVIEAGRVVESGSYADMVNSDCGYFNQMIS